MAIKQYTREDISRLLKERLGDRRIYELAAELGISKQYLGSVISGKEVPGKAILAPLGIEAVTIYRKVAA